MAEEKKKDGKDEKEGEAAAPAKKSKKMLFIGIGAFVFLVLAIGIPVTILALKSKGETPKVESLAADAAQTESAATLVPEPTLEEEELAEGEEPLGAILPLDTFVVNLNGGRYIRCQMQLEFQSRDIPKKFYTRSVPIRDGIIMLLTSKTADEVGSEKGKEQLRAEVKDLIDETLKKEEIKRVYFTQFVIQ